MTAAVMTETLVAGVGLNIQTTGSNLKVVSYTVTTSNADDWIIADDFDVVTNAYAELVSTGVHCACTIDGSTTNKVVLTGTAGANRVICWGY